jgi:hypothetical protein
LTKPPTPSLDIAPLPEKGQNRFLWVCAIIYIILLLIATWRHEMWRDELEAWLIVRDCTLPGMLAHLHTIAHPPLWYLLILAVQWVSNDPAAMQVLHILIAVGVMALLLFYSPFTRTQKGLLIGNYYFLYEYGAISRNYSLCLLFAFLFLIMLCRSRRSWRWQLVPLLLLCQTHVLGIILALGFSLYLFIKFFQNRRTDGKKDLVRILLTIAMLAVGLGLSTYYAYPFQGMQIWSDLHLRFLNIPQAAVAWKAIAHSYFPLPPISTTFWNQSILGSGHLLLILSPLCVLGSVFLFRARPAILFFYLAVTGMLTMFFYLYFPGYLRHHGFFFITLLIGFWLLIEQSRNTAYSNKKRVNFALTGMLGLQALAGMMAVTLEIQYPFSASRQACQYIKAHHLQHHMIVGDPDYVMQSVAAWLNRKLYYPAISAEGSFIVWNDPRRQNMDPAKAEARSASRSRIQEQAQRMADEKHKEVLLLTNYRLHIPLLHSITGTIEPSEKIFIYLLKPSP